VNPLLGSYLKIKERTTRETERNLIQETRFYQKTGEGDSQNADVEKPQNAIQAVGKRAYGQEWSRKQASKRSDTKAGVCICMHSVH
jgi:hypothetical protein